MSRTFSTTQIFGNNMKQDACGEGSYNCHLATCMGHIEEASGGDGKFTRNPATFILDARVAGEECKHLPIR
eukprot:591079-Prorocentrum_minimum.AAC.1